jgi:hypothetical protein
MPQYNLFGEIDVQTMPEPEMVPEMPEISQRHKKRIIGDNFIVVKCLSCSQMIMVDPEYYPLDAYQDKICECCNGKYQDKYMRYLKLKL